MKTSITLTPEIQKELNAKLRVYFLVTLFVSAGLLAISIVLYVLCGSEMLFVAIISATLIIFSILMLLGIRKANKSNPNFGVTTEYEFETDFFTATSFKDGEKIGFSKCEYRNLVKVMTTKNLVLLYTTASTALPVSKRDFTTDQIAFLMQQVKKKK